MNPNPHKQLLQQAFDELAQGNGRPFMDTLAPDIRWTIHGSTPWSGTCKGKTAVAEQLMRPLFAQFATPYIGSAHRFIAEDDMVVVEFRGRVQTKAGKPYNNTYCYVCRFVEGKMAELVEYMDTDLLNAALEAPAAVHA